MTDSPDHEPAPPPGKRRRGLLISVFLTLVLLEGICRLFIAAPNTTLRPSEDEALGYELSPGEHQAEGNLFQVAPYPVVVDEQGCRVLQRGTDTSSRKALILGDSFTYGDGVPYQDTFIHILEQSLRAQGNELHLRNCAVPGYNLTQLARQAQLQIQNAPPEWVMVGFFSNDLRGAPPLQELLGNPWLYGPGAEWSRLLRMMNLGILVAAGHLDPPHLQKGEITEALNLLEKAIETTGKKPLALIIEKPHHPEVDFPSLLTQRGWKVIKGPEIRDESLRIPRDGHLNRKGHEAVADALITPPSEWLPTRGEP